MSFVFVAQTYVIAAMVRRTMTWQPQRLEVS